MVIQHNIPAMNSHRNLGINNAATAKNLEKLSSGYKINRAGDDAAGLAISEKMRGQIRGLAMATQNAQNGVSLIQTAEGGLNETHAILQRMRELAVQSANGTYDDEVDRANITKEVTALKSEIDRISSSTNYNGIKLLDGTMGATTMSGTSTTAELKAMTDAGFGEAFAITTAADTSATTNDTNPDAVAGQTGSLTVHRDDTGNITSIALQVGDKTYMGTPSTDFATAGTVTFKDADGKGVATVALTATAGTGAGISIAADPKLKGSSVITGITLGAAGASSGAAVGEKGVQVASKGNELIFQIGANGTADQRVGLHVDNMASGNLGSHVKTAYNASGTIADINVGTREAANDAIAVIDAATNQVSGTRADLGALQNRLEHTINNLGVTRENLQAAESSIRDVDMAKEMMEFTKNNILVQASQAMLAQANQLPQGVLQLLR